MKVDIVGNTKQLPKQLIPTIRKIFSAIKTYEKLEGNMEVAVSFVSDEEIQSLNKQYRGKDRPTDVLSFPVYTKEELIGLPVDLPITLGDIVISIDRGKEQAKLYNHSLLREFTFLAVHGLLHLVGYDHNTPEAEKEMFSYQNKLLKEHGLER